MKTLNSLLLVVVLVLMAGCGEEEFSRYPSVPVLAYEQGDFIRDLSDPNEELVYNAICNLSGSYYSEILYGEDADPDSPEYKTAEEVFQKVCSLLESKEPYTVAACLRFLQFFAYSCEPHQELIEIACGVDSSHPQVQFEQTVLLLDCADENTRLPEPLLRRLKESRSWIVSRTAYFLIGQTGEASLREELLHQYHTTPLDRDRFILLDALSQRMTPEIVGLFEEEIFTSNDSEKRYLLILYLTGYMDNPRVTEWLYEHHKQFSEEEQTGMFDSFDENQLISFLDRGYIPEDEMLEDWIKTLTTNKDEESMFRKRALLYEQAVLKNPQLTDRWLGMKDEAEQKLKCEANLREAFQQDISPAVTEFLFVAEDVLTTSELPAAEQKKIVRRLISDHMETLSDTK